MLGKSFKIIFVIIMFVVVSYACVPAQTQEISTQTPYVITATPDLEVTLSPTVEETVPQEITETITTTVQTCRETRGRLEYREFYTEYLSEPLGMRVYLPPCYDYNPQKRYPVLYLLHGQSFSDDQWDRLGADETADELINQGEAPPFIIVMPRENLYLEDDKISKYGDALVYSLVPWIDDTYNTCRIRECRAIGGISRGSAWALRVGFQHWELFSKIGLHSFAPFSGDFYNAPFWFDEIYEDAYPLVYMDFGYIDALKEVARLFEGRFTEYGVPHEWIINPGTHDEEYWASHVEDYLRWYTFEWHKLELENPSMDLMNTAPTATVMPE